VRGVVRDGPLPCVRARDALRGRATGTTVFAMARERIAVVTGANRGIGQEIARELESRGLQVLRGTREPAAGDGSVKLDVTSPGDIAALARSVGATGGVDVLVNNAGASFDGFDAKVAARTLAVNFFGAMNLTDALLPTMREGGRVVMVSSGLGRLSCLGPALRARFDAPALDRAGLLELMNAFTRDVADGTFDRHGWPASAYSVSKVGMNALVRVLARELAGDPRRILVNSADPGWVKTRMGGRSAPRTVEHGARTPVYLALLPDGGPTGGFFNDERRTPW
jgi:NAD(P)-dependent dehydrogenase (short-subunit alcohol dehydrogenase family)